MATAGPGLPEDQFMCSVCWDVFTDPVTIPCGHNFCKSCITTNWIFKAKWQCPLCKEVFDTRPNLRVNLFVSQMTAHFRALAQQQTTSSSWEEQQVESKDVSTKTEPVPSGETHLEPPLKRSAVQRHQLIPPVTDLTDRCCTKHNRPLELFCKDDHTCVCMLCMIVEHRTHQIVPLEEAHTENKTELRKTETKIQAMIETRQLKIEDIKHWMELSDDDAKREKAAALIAFSHFAQLLEEQQQEVAELLDEKQRATEEQGRGLITELEKEVFHLTKKRFEVEQLSCCEDHLDFLQRFQSLNSGLPTTDWTDIKIPPPVYEGAVRMGLDRLLDDVYDELMGEFVPQLVVAELLRVQQFAVDVTLDPNTAHPKLILSSDGKEVKHGKIKKLVKDRAERFSSWKIVLGNQSFSSGRFYFEVKVGRNTAWDLGVVSESVNRKGKGPLTPQDGFWAMGLMDGEYTAHEEPPKEVADEPKTVGVFVDYEEGLVSFFDVDAAEAIYSFTDCSFPDKLYPFISVSGKNVPLIITPVTHNQ
ncbi:E3 ubiquitin-protein ligase TRIM11-like [Echeneis naucrates]|uniref:E3 ubiquitin-protein ligase TRIM11-like n=1 Tax=Echeneis naucrates TaxID=173247 RepID=UPI00111455BD|nr:E3 ubiquitin-protein ligase TRIM11-like [Echeneis naucrates]